eukprot:scaffold42622_cov13-Tisochrysis_lutea.AAC.1
MEKIMAVQFWGNLLVWFLLSTRDGIESPEKWFLRAWGVIRHAVLATQDEDTAIDTEGPAEIKG